MAVAIPHSITFPCSPPRLRFAPPDSLPPSRPDPGLAPHTLYGCRIGAIAHSASQPRFHRLQRLGSGQGCFGDSLAACGPNARELFPRRNEHLCRRRKARYRVQRRRASVRIDAVAGDRSTRRMETSDGWLEVEDPRTRAPPRRGRLFDVNQAWEIIRLDLHYFDWKARRDVLAIKTLHDKVVHVLNPAIWDRKLVEILRGELAELQQDLAKSHEQVYLSEARVSWALQKLADMEALVSDKVLRECTPVDQEHGIAVVESTSSGQTRQTAVRNRNGLNVSGPVRSFSPALKNFWYPVAFSADFKDDRMIPFECFEEPWVMFRGKDGRVGCVQNSCAHRACPLHLGVVKDGRIQCPYHGWEYATSGECEKMPSTKPVSVSIRSLPCIEQDGMVWIWPGGEVPSAALPPLSAPDGFTTHAEIVIELPVEHGLLMENLLDLVHAPFTHTTTFARGWPVPSLVRFCTPISSLKGFWDPYPIDMEFQPPCMVLSTIGISKPGKLEGNSTSNCLNHLHQLHVCVPSSQGKTRLLYRLSLDFLSILKHVPYIRLIWKYLANQVLDEDLKLVIGQQDRMNRGANVWNMPVAYDKLGVRYRRWRLAVENGEQHYTGVKS